MDASIVNFRSLEHWVNTSSPAVQGFARPANVEYIGTNVMESWAIASPLGANFTRVWRDNFGDALRTGAYTWVSEQPAELVGTLNGYLAEHVAW